MNFIKKATIFTFFAASIGSVFCPRLIVDDEAYERALQRRERARRYHLHDQGYGVDGDTTMTPEMLKTMKEVPLRRQMIYTRAERLVFLRKVTEEMGRLDLFQDGVKENRLGYAALFEKGKSDYLGGGDVAGLKNIFKARVRELVVLAKGEALKSNLSEVPFIFGACERLRFVTRRYNEDALYVIRNNQTFFEDRDEMDVRCSVLDLLGF